MKITSLELQNITRYKQASMTFGSKISGIFGLNGEGKTTIADAIADLLTGACDRTDKAGKGQENLVTTGERQGSISASVSNNGAEPIVVTRFVPGELLIEGQHGNKTQLQSNLCEYLGVDVGVLSAALSTTAFLDAKPSEQKSMILGLLGLSFGRPAVLEQIVTELSKVIDEAGALPMLKAAPANLFTGEASTFEKLHAHFYTLRRDYRRDLKNMGELPPASLVNEDIPVESAMAQMKELRGLKAGLERQVSQSQANVGQRDMLVREIVELREKLETAGDPEAAKDELEKLRPQLADLKGELDTLVDTARTYSDVAQAFEESTSCPLSADLAEPINCGIAKTKREKIIADLYEKTRVAMDVKYPEIDAKIKELKQVASDLEGQAYKPSRLELEAEIENKESDLAALPATDIDLAKTEQEISTLAERITKGEGKVAEMNQIIGARRELEKAQAKRQQLEQTVECLEALVDVLSPSGLPGKILGETIGPIQQTANARLQEITGGRYELEMVLDPDFAIFVSHDGMRTDLKRLSSSERMRVGVVLQSVLVGLTGLRFMIVDNLDVLDNNNRGLLMDALLALSDELDQVLVLSTVGPNGAVNPHIEGVAFYELVDGQLREVG
jgi:DNA repair exonuclease SbcCD ATPase subunit